MSFFVLALKRAKIALEACNLFACMYITIRQRKHDEREERSQCIIEQSKEEIKISP